MTDEQKLLTEIRDVLKTTILNSPLRIEGGLPGVLYEGYAKEIGISDQDRAWFIVRKQTLEGITSTQFANTINSLDEIIDDSGNYNKSWEKRKSYFFK